METWAIVPLKTVSQAKTRLAGTLTERERQALYQRLASRVLQSLASCPAVTRLVAVTRCPVMAELAIALGATICHESTDRGTAAACAHGLRQLPASAQRALLIAADLPFCDEQAISQLLERPEPLVLVPDHHRCGTNALLCSPPRLIEPAFGPNSLNLHLQQAEHLNLECYTMHPSKLSFDLDTPQDLANLPHNWSAEANIEVA